MLELKEVQEVEEEDKREHQEEGEVVNIEVEEEVQEEVQEEELMTIKLTNLDPIDLELLLLQMLMETKLLKNQEKKDNHSEEKTEIILLKDNLEPEEVSRPKSKKMVTEKETGAINQIKYTNKKKVKI
jgi:hypothetical protein